MIKLFYRTRLEIEFVVLNTKCHNNVVFKASTKLEFCGQKLSSTTVDFLKLSNLSHVALPGVLRPLNQR